MCFLCKGKERASLCTSRGDLTDRSRRMYIGKVPETMVFPELLARLKEFESPTFRLGGGRSILLSYRRISKWAEWAHLIINSRDPISACIILTNFIIPVKEIRHIFLPW